MGAAGSQRVHDLRRPLLLAGALTILLGLDASIGSRWRESGYAPPVAPAHARAPLGFANSYAEALAGADEAIDGAQRRASERPNDWLVHEALARRHLARARLTGAFDDYAAAQAALDAAFATAPAGTGPHMTQAVLHFTMHRLNRAAAFLEAIEGYAVPPDAPEFAEVVAMRGDIAFYRGDYSGAISSYDEADRNARGTATFRRAMFHSKTGKPDLAQELLDRAERQLTNPSPQVLSNLELQRGIIELERGRLDEALGRFRRANGLFPGHWLIEEHIAEVTALKADAGRAERLYEDIVRRTGHPEFMDALAALALARGDRAAQAGWSERAARGWRTRLAQFPEAAYGHALDHCLGIGNRRCALALAERNHAARPYGEAKVQLAKALLLVGDRQRATRVIEEVLRSPWATAEAHAVAAEVYSAVEQRHHAERERLQAMKMNSHVFRM